MFKIVLALALHLLGSDASATAPAACSNSAGGTCSIARWTDGRATFRTSQWVKTLRFKAPKPSAQSDWSLTFGPDVAKDCQAEQTCSNGAKISCQAVGPNTQCTSNATSVGCLTVDNDGEGTSGSSATCPSG